jgi:hypothetical protein
VLQPDRKNLPWLIEHAKWRWRRVGLLGALLGTALRSLHPSSFWRRVELAHRISGLRLAGYAIVCLVLLHLTLGVCRFGPLFLAVPEVWQVYQEESRLIKRHEALDLSSIPPPHPTDQGFWMRNGWGGDGWYPLWNHGQRTAPVPAWAEGVGGDAGVDFWFRCEVPEGLGLSQSPRAEPFGDHTDLRGAWVSALDQYAGYRQGFFELLAVYSALDRGEAISVSLWPYTAEWPLIGNTGWVFSSPSYGWDNGWIDQSVFFAPPILVPLAATLILPLTFITVARTLGKKGIREVHFLRALAYSMGGLTVAHSLSALAMGITLLILLVASDTSSEWASALIRTLDAGVWFRVHFWGGALWLFWFWWMFCNRYLRIPHAFWVALLLSVMAYMVAFAVGFTLAEVFIPDALRDGLLNW